MDSEFDFVSGSANTISVNQRRGSSNSREYILYLYTFDRNRKVHYVNNSIVGLDMFKSGKKS